MNASPLQGSLRNGLAVTWLAASAMWTGATSTTLAQGVIINGGYHAQTTSFFCGAASVEMMLDVPAVTGANPFVANMISVGDGATVPLGQMAYATTNNGAVTSRAEAFIYGVNHGLNTVNGYTYYNGYAPVGAGTDSAGLVTAINLLDNPNINVNPAIPAAGFGTHAYTGYNLAPTLTQACIATRTMANAMQDYQVPAQAVVESGAHSICVYGVDTNGTPGNGNNYTINGVLIHDPWTGYVAQRLNAGDAAPLAAGGWGLGFNTWLRYGYDVVPGGAATQLPNGNVVNVRLGAWFNYFNPSGAQAGTAAFNSTGMKFTIEPQGPESLDTGNLASDDSLPSPPALLGSQENASQADLAAISDLAADSTLSTEVGLTGGAFDSVHETLLQMPGDTAGEGDWLVPYDGSGGTNDVTGAMLIDSQTGVIDQATWLDPAQDGMSSLSLSQLDQMFSDEASGMTPNDNLITPEPSSALLLCGSALGFLAGFRPRRRRPALL